MSTSNDLWATDLAEAWDKGYLTGYQDRRKERDYDPGQNPYRAAAHTDEEIRAAMGRRRHLAEMTRQAFADGLYETSAADYAEALRRARGKPTTDIAEDAWEVIVRVRDDYPRVINDAPTEEIVEALADAGLLATARTRPTRDELDRVISDGLREHGAFRTDLIADAVLALFRGGDK